MCITCKVLEQEPTTPTQEIRQGIYKIVVCDEHLPLYDDSVNYIITVQKQDSGITFVSIGEA